MSKNRELKEQQLSEIVEKVKGAQSIVIASYSGLTVAQVTDLRKQCREGGASYCVLKNRLFGLALKEVGIEGVDDLLNGPNAFIFSNKDAVCAPKIVSDFISKNKLESLKVTGGVMEGKAIDAKTVEMLASTPSREELLGTLVGCLNSPVSGLVAVLDQIAEQKESA